MLESILSTNGHYSQNKFCGALIKAECRNMYKWNVWVKAFKVGSEVSSQGMAGWKGEVRDNIAEIFQGCRKSETLVLRNIKPRRLGGGLRRF
jgi:hypothetical protein